jgi:hypothetical protein
MQTVRDNTHVNEAPLSSAFDLHVEHADGGARLTWRAQPSGSSRPAYVVLRTNDGNGCRSPNGGAAECFLRMDYVQDLRETTFFDHPPPGHYTYRVALIGGYRPDVVGGDLMLLSRDAPSIRVP